MTNRRPAQIAASLAVLTLALALVTPIAPSVVLTLISMALTAVMWVRMPEDKWLVDPDMGEEL